MARRKKGEMTDEQEANALGISVRTVRRARRVLGFGNERLSGAVRNGAISVGDAEETVKALAGLDSASADYIIAAGLDGGRKPLSKFAGAVVDRMANG